MDARALGTRICILGPSNSGKSTLAVHLGQALELPVVHLDQLRHVPGTHWVERPDTDFDQMHDSAVAEDRWVIEGNYSRLLPGRLARATGFILLDAPAPVRLARYVRRTLGKARREGGLDGVEDRLSLPMVRFILGPANENRRRYRQLFDEVEVPKAYLASRRALSRFRREGGLASFARRG